MVDGACVEPDDGAAHRVERDLVVAHDDEIEREGSRRQHPPLAGDDRVNCDELRLDDVLKVGDLLVQTVVMVDEAMTVPLFGGRRAIRIRAGSRNFAGGIDTLAEMAVKDCRIVIEAGDLRPESPLRKACERAKTAVAIGCYPDTERDLAKLIDDELRIANLRIAPDARASLMALLGGDRQASRNELRKLTLFALGEGDFAL